MSEPGAFQDVDIERVREYWNARPCNIRHSPAPVGTKDYFDQVEARKYFVEPHIPGFAEFGRWSSKRVLEIGCGIGTDTVNFARNGATVTAVDLSDVSISVARQRIELLGLQDKVQLLTADAERLDEYLEPEPYDLVYSFGVIHHAPHPLRIMDQVRNHFTRPGSVIKVMVYNRHSWKVLRMLLQEKGAFWRLDDLIAKNSEAQWGSPVTYAYSRRSVRALFEDLEIVDLFVDHVFPFRIEDYVEYRYVKEWYFRHIPPRLWRVFERTMGWHLCVTAKVPEAIRTP